MKAISLQNVLQLNAASCTATGIFLVSFPNTVQEIFSAQKSWPFLEVGGFLIGFSLLLFFISRSNPIQRRGIRTIIALDSLWVVASALLIIFQPFALSVIGNILIAAVALWVALMIYLQATGWKEYGIASDKK